MKTRHAQAIDWLQGYLGSALEHGTDVDEAISDAAYGHFPFPTMGESVRSDAVSVALKRLGYTWGKRKDGSLGYKKS